jgi:hypothetical protein
MEEMRLFSLLLQSSLLIDAFLILAPVAYFMHKGMTARKALKALGFKKIKARNLVKETVLLLGTLFLLFLALNVFFTLINFNDLSKVYETVKKISLPFMAYLLIVRVSAEEMFFRGLLVQKIGVFASTLLFALAHALYGSIVEVIGAFVLGLVLAMTFDRTRNLWPNIIAHIAYNAVILFFFVV